MDADYRRKQSEKIAETLKKTDVVVTTALIPGKKAPILITKNMLKDMKPGSVIIDLAAIAGGNCEITKMNEDVVTENMVTVKGPTNILNAIAQDASKLYSKNLWNFLELLLNKEENNIKININSEDEIIKETLLTNQGNIIKKNL